MYQSNVYAMKAKITKNTKKAARMKEAARVEKNLSRQEIILKRRETILLKAIKEDFEAYPFFTRESLMLHFKDSPAFGRVSTISRYTMIREAVVSLVDQGILARPGNSRTLLCLASRENSVTASLDFSSGQPFLKSEHYASVQEVITKHYPTGASTDVMALVRHWALSDKEGAAHLTEDNMRVLVRHILRDLVKDGVLKENKDYTYTVMMKGQKD